MNNKINPVSKYFLKLGSMVKSNIRDYGMYIALAVIFVVFTVMTGGTFLGAQNFTNLLNQTAYIAVIAVGMTLVIVIREIDLSVGYLGAFLGAVVVVAVEQKNTSLFIAITGALILTIVIGFIKGSLVARIKIPSFVVTLGAMFIFQGLLMTITESRTIPITNPIISQIGTGYLLQGLKLSGMNLVTLIFGVLLIAFIIYSGISNRIKNNVLNIKNESLSIYITKLVFIIGVSGFILFSLASYRGISYLLLITLVVTLIYHIITTKTVVGRRIYAVGGNPDAAELSGISVKRITVLVFISMGILSLIAGIMFAANVQNTSPNHGQSWEMYAIAASYIGGTSAKGGVGKVINAVVGAVVIQALTNGMRIAGVSSTMVPIILGSVLVLAVIFDIYTRNVKEVDYVGVVLAKRKYAAELDETKTNYLNAKQQVLLARKTVGFDDKELVELEYELTRTLGDYNKYKDIVGNAKEEDFTETQI